MKDRIQVLGIAVDIASTKVAAEASIQNLTAQGSKVVYFLNSETLLLLQKQKEKIPVLEESELVLPGTAGVNNSIDEVLGYKRDSFFCEEYMNEILDYAVEQGHEILLAAKDQESFISVQEHIHEKHQYLTLSGAVLNENEESFDHLVNEINSVAPDILLLALDEEKQLELLEKYRNQMNADLILVTGSLLYDKAVGESETPKSGLWYMFRKNGPVRIFFDNLKIKLRLKRQKENKN